MYRIVIPLLLGLTASCSAPEPPEVSGEKNTSPNAEAPTEIVTGTDSNAITSPPHVPQRKVDTLLLHPFDLNTYKRKKRGANSSRGDRLPYYFKPDTAGIYYNYFLFHLPTQRYIGHDPNAKNVTSPSDGGREIVVFKPDDADQNMYNDPNEVLIEFTQWYNDTDLPELAFVGWTRNEITARFGAPDIVFQGSIAYVFGHHTLLFHFRGDQVNWLKYAHTNAPANTSSAFQQLFEKNVFGM